MTLGGEKASVQKPFGRYAIDAGWTYLTPEEALNLRRGLTRATMRTARSIQALLNPIVHNLIRQ